MHKLFFLALLAVCVLAACKSSPPASGRPAASPGTVTITVQDAVSKKLQELAGNAATDCGRLASQSTSDLDTAGKCATQAAQQKHSFYVAYDMPGMTVGVAGNSDGKLFSVQSQTGGAGLASEPCPAELRVAPSGRVTCYAPGTFPMGGGMGSHSTITMPPTMGSPHAGAGAANPHQPTDGKLPASHP